MTRGLNRMTCRCRLKRNLQALPFHHHQPSLKASSGRSDVDRRVGNSPVGECERELQVNESRKYNSCKTTDGDMRQNGCWFLVGSENKFESE